MEVSMLKLDDIALEVVSGGWGSTKISINKNYLKISANNNEVEKGGMILFNIAQFNGKQVNVTAP